MSTVRRFRIGSLLLLTAVWLLMWGSWSWGTLFMGLAMGALVLLVFPMPRASSRIRIRPLALLWLTITFLANLVWSSGLVAWMAIRPGGVRRSRGRDPAPRNR